MERMTARRLREEADRSITEIDKEIEELKAQLGKLQQERVELSHLSRENPAQTPVQPDEIEARR